MQVRGAGERARSLKVRGEEICAAGSGLPEAKRGMGVEVEVRGKSASP